MSKNVFKISAAKNALKIPTTKNDPSIILSFHGFIASFESQQIGLYDRITHNGQKFAIKSSL